LREKTMTEDEIAALKTVNQCLVNAILDTVGPGGGSGHAMWGRHATAALMEANKDIPARHGYRVALNAEINRITAELRLPPRATP